MSNIATIFILNSVLLSYSCAEIRYHPNSSFHVQQCPPWSYYNEHYHKCHCVNDIKCNDNEAYLEAGHCATYDDNNGIISRALCPYFQSDGFNMTKLDNGHWYIQLPENMSELNDYMCGRMNRRGRVCSKCKDGFGPAVMSVGFEIQCSRCIGALYGIPLHLCLELCPITIFYLILLIFQINITSAPMTSYIMYSQLVVTAWDRIFSGDMRDLIGLFWAMNRQYKLFAKIVLSIYDIWNLRFFRYLMPSFCISSRLKPIHIAFLGYVSVFYPLCLIFLTWGCVELHNRNFRLIVWLWRPFHTCFVHLRRGWNTKSDIIDVFASLFLLSFTKSLYQVLLFLTNKHIYQEIPLLDKHWGSSHVLNIDMNIVYGSTEHLIFAIPTIIMTCIFYVLPALLIIFYPVGLFRACLSKCKLDRIALYIFVEKFYGCYRDGLNGGRDMRSFAGLSFVIMVILMLADTLGGLLMISNNDPFFIRNTVFTITLIFISLCQPYKEMYMNVLDVLLLANLGLLCHLVSSYQGFKLQQNFIFTFIAMVLLPLAGFILLIIIRVLKKIQAFKVCIRLFKQLSLFPTTQQERELVEPTAAEMRYGAIR